MSQRLRQIGLLAGLGLILAGCADRAPPGPPESPELAACREEARTAASGPDLSRQSFPGQVANEERLRRIRAEAESTAYTDCLRRRGLARGGGVEPVRRPGIW